MKRILRFIRTSILGGLVVILPGAILIAAFGWLYRFITNLIKPLTNLILARGGLRESIAELMVVLILLLLCFFCGVAIKTSFGIFFQRGIEARILSKLPGYLLVKETVLQFLGGKQFPFSTVALVDLFGNDTRVTAFVTDEHIDGSFTVFVPTGPNPTSGNIFHVKSSQVRKFRVPIENAMRSIISCGAGSSALFQGQAAGEGSNQAV